MTKLTLPLGKSQFLDANGRPLAGGKIYHYIPATTTPKDTWQDGAGTILNTNPVTLDAAGEAVILGTGSYRQILTDSLGNLQWDQVATAPNGVDSLPLTGGTLTGALFAPSIGITGGQLLSVAPTGDPVATLASLNVQGTTTSTTVREYLAAISLLAFKRNGASGAVQPSVALYVGIEGENGTGDITSLKTTVQQDVSSGTYNAIAHEITVVNNVANRGEALGAAGLAAPYTYGHVVDGAGTFRNTSAYLITGPGTAVFNRGLTIAENAVAQTSFQDLGNAAISYEIQGTHTYGMDTKAATFTQAAIRLGNGQYVKARDVGDTVDITVFVQSGTNLIFGDAGHGSTNVSGTHILPLADNALTLGSSGFRWSAVWAANGTIQTSDPTLKTDITAIPADAAKGLLSAIDPITFRWKVGGADADGNERPGKRLHWGWDASQVKAAFDAAGMDFGGYVLAEDGTQHLRPDQLVPALWRLVQMLSDRVEALEKGNAP